MLDYAAPQLTEKDQLNASHLAPGPTFPHHGLALPSISAVQTSRPSLHCHGPISPTASLPRSEALHISLPVHSQGNGLLGKAMTTYQHNGFVWEVEVVELTVELLAVLCRAWRL